MTPNEHRSAASPTARERATEFYAGFNHAVANGGETDELAATLADGVRWTDATTGSRAVRTYTGIEAILENVIRGPGRRADHLQALPERFIETDETTVVMGAYVGTIDGRNFDVAFAHVFDLDDGRIGACTAYRDTALEQRVFDA
ncbi:nuclear transport factor 2 family protein [Natrinema soli]|uniref:Nuclear transport factor 2 family protein n=1 Tax=Natrinema soli TaxID=1930624 RepID=A0ABD5SK01_9EURY|nr:nuclear transport factor 2 family protein [Natrinema soli]